MISDQTWSVLAADLDQQQLLDVIFTVGSYEVLSWMMRSLDLALDDDIEGLLTDGAG